MSLIQPRQQWLYLCVDDRKKKEAKVVKVEEEEERDAVDVVTRMEKDATTLAAAAAATSHSSLFSASILHPRIWLLSALEGSPLAVTWHFPMSGSSSFSSYSSSSSSSSHPGGPTAPTIMACSNWGMSSRDDNDGDDRQGLALVLERRFDDGSQSRRLCGDRKGVFDHLHPRPLFKSVRLPLVGRSWLSRRVLAHTLRPLSSSLTFIRQRPLPLPSACRRSGWW